MATSNNELIRVEHVVKEFDGGAVKALNDCSIDSSDMSSSLSVLRKKCGKACDMTTFTCANHASVARRSAGVSVSSAGREKSGLR